MKTNTLVMWFVAGTAVAAVALSWYFRKIWVTPEAWAASLIFNLATTALAVFFINLVLARRESKERQDARRLRKARRKLREQRRKKAVQEFLGFESYWPILMCLSSGDEVILAGTAGDLLAVRKVIKQHGPTYMRQAAWLRHHTLLYSRYFSAKELSWLHQLERNLDALALTPEADVRPEMEKIGIASSLEGFAAASRALFQSFGLPLCLDEVDAFSERMNTLKRKWDVVGIRKRMGKELAPLFDAEHPDIAKKLRAEDEREATPGPQTGVGND